MKRNVPCPGYEKTLKWSTKYELLAPPQPSPSRGHPLPTIETGESSQSSPASALPPEIASGIEALAAVIPGTGKGKQAVRDDPVPPSPDQDLVPYDLDREGDTLDSPEGEDFESPEELDSVNPGFLEGFMEQDGVVPQDFDCDFTGGSNQFSLEDFANADISGQPMFNDTPVNALEARPSRSLLLNFYRLPAQPTIAQPQDMESALIQHYFQDVCVLFSSYDSNLNPFRVAVQKVYQDCPSIWFGIQSMAAAHLANTNPHMSAVGMVQQNKAYQCLEDELNAQASGGAQNSDRSLLSILLLGLSTSWHESSMLGQEFLEKARSLIVPKLVMSTDRVELQRKNQFFEEALIYWEMLMGFVSHDTMASTTPRVRQGIPKASAASRRPDGKIVPHPWTGIAPTVLMLFAEVGRVVHRERVMHVYGPIDQAKIIQNLESAGTLEEDLLAAEYPLADELADLGDTKTSKRDFTVIAEAYRCAGLLEIYRVFPSILQSRLQTDRFTMDHKVKFSFTIPRFGTVYENTDRRIWLASLALHILGSLKSLPTSSGTCCLQPILLVTAASELKFVASIDYFDMFANDASILAARQFVDRRLNEYALRLPAKPIRRVLDLINEVWRRFDGGQEVFWMDVMIQNGLETVMG
jgi:hypothetical protein